MPQLPLGLLSYRWLTTLIAPFAPVLLRQRLLRGKEDGVRLGERLGRSEMPRPDGELIWIHGASVGESLAALPLIDALAKDGRTILVTSGTVTSAQVLKERLPQGVVHQFAVLDTPFAVRRFLNRWKPDAGLFVDSEIWPNMIVEAHRRGVKLALVNGRMSEKSFAGWQRAKASARALLSRYDLCLAQDKLTAERLVALGARHVAFSGSLKADAPPLPADPQQLAALKAAIGNRPVLLAAQTHPGEDETILPVHDALRKRFADLLTIIVPRHPERGDDIAMLCGSRHTVRRSSGALPSADSAIYIADTIGELGLFYRLTGFAFIGGSLIPHGGQNPLEPARLGCAVLTGPYTDNFRESYDAILAAQGVGRVTSSTQIVELAAQMLADPAACEALAQKARDGAATLGGAVETTRAAIEDMMASHARP